MKVFQIGFGRTGTKSLSRSLKETGLSVLDLKAERLNRAKLVRAYAENRIDWLLALANRYDVVEDHPWPLLFRELDERHPNARFIYTTRSAETWLESIKNHTLQRGPSEAKRHIFGADTPFGHESAYVDRFLSHQAAVRDYFGKRADFLEIDLGHADASSRIADFLGLASFSLLHLNRSSRS